MTLIDANKFLGYLIFSKHIDSLKCHEVKEAVEKCKVDVFDKIRAEIEQITDTMGVRYNQYVSKIDVLQIIDKYKENNDDSN